MKHKKNKSHKKTKKSKRHRHKDKLSSSDETSSNDSLEWVEKVVDKSTIVESKDSKHSDAVQRDEWMNMSTLFSCTSQLDKKKQREAEKKSAKVTLECEPGRSSKELNPYWKNGGTGLPEKSPEKSIRHTKDPTWLIKSLQRAEEQAKIEGKSLEEVAAERWGSLETIYSMIKEAQRGSKKSFLKPSNESACSSRNEISYTANGVKRWKKQDSKSMETHREQTSKSETWIAPPEDESSVLSEAEMNQLGARIIKAEIMGDTDLVNKLKQQLENARETRKNGTKPKEETVILMRTSATGSSRPIEPKSSSKRQKVETHVHTERVLHFADDDKYSLQTMFHKEKGRNVDDDDAMFVKIASKRMDMDEAFEQHISSKKLEEKNENRERTMAIQEHKRISKSLENCHWCFESNRMLKHMIITVTSNICLSLPACTSLTIGHCILTPTQHVACEVQLDEDVSNELLCFKRSLTTMFASQKKYPIFFEIYKNRHKFPHMRLECVPLPIEEYESAPMYFKKALLECETEWSTNKKIVDVNGKNIRNVVPRGLAYFAIYFGINKGYAHVIENERLFPDNFAAEIIGGMLDLDHNTWLRPRSDNFDVQKSKVLEFNEIWKSYDFRHDKT